MTEQGSEISPLSKPEFDSSQTNSRDYPKFREHQPASLFKNFCLLEQKVFADENGNQKTELQPYIPKSNDGEILFSSIEGLNLIKHWMLLKSKENGDLKKENLEKIHEEFKLIRSLFETIKINITDKRGNNVESETHMTELKQELSKMRMMMKRQLINEPVPTPINIVIKNDSQVKEYLKKTSGLRHDIAGAMTPPYGNIDFVAKHVHLFDEYRPRILSQLRRTRKSIDREIRKLFGDVLDEYMQPSDIERIFLDDLVPIMKDDEGEGNQFDFNINIDQKVGDNIYVYCSEEHITSIFENIATNLVKVYKARDILEGNQANLPKMVLMDIKLSEDGLYLEIRIRDTGIGFPEEYLEKGFEAAVESGYKPKELKEAGYKEIESNGIGMKKETKDLRNKYGGKITPGNYEDTVAIGGKSIKISGGEQIISIPISMEVKSFFKNK